MALAIFDLDNTLLHGDSDHAWGEFLVTKGIVDSELYKRKNDEFLLQYQSGDLDINEYLEFALKPLVDNDIATLDTLRAEFLETVIEPMILPKGEALIAEHKAKGDVVMIITATNEFVTAPIAERLGMDAIIGTTPEMEDGLYTGRVAGIPSFQRGKVERLEQWMLENRQTIYGSYFYSDSYNDLPLLRVVDNPVAVDADERLTKIAERYYWDVMSLRD
jgi:HAD superfamily hydrolase (TIGR01490 family)